MNGFSTFTSEQQFNFLKSAVQKFGLSRITVNQDLYEVWQFPNSEDELILPLKQDRGDFSILLARAYRELEFHFSIDVSNSLDLMQMQLAGGLRSANWKKESPVQAGLINWLEGEKIYKSAQQTLISAAKATHERRLRHGKSSSFIARNFLERTFMGQTKIGSFVVTAHIPGNENFFLTKKSATKAAEGWPESELVTGNDIVRTFETALNAVRFGLDEYKANASSESFFSLVDDGVSIELLDAVHNLSKDGDAAISVENAEGLKQFEVVFDAPESLVLQKVAESLLEAAPPVNASLVGEVSRLDNSTKHPARLVRMDVKQGAKISYARVRLNEEQYELAVEAHRDKNWLKVNGQLQKDGRDFWLYNANDVSIIEHENWQQPYLFETE